MSPEKALRLPDYLGHIAGAIDKILAYTAGMDDAAFISNSLVQDAVVRNFEIIGEASNKITKHHKEFSRAHSEMGLEDAYKQRNVIAHEYFTVDPRIIWTTIQGDLPKLRQQTQAALDELRLG